MNKWKQPEYELPKLNEEVEILASDDMEYGTKEVKKVSEWTKTSKDGDEYVSKDGKMHIFNMGKETQ